MSEHQPTPNMSSVAKEASCQYYAVNDRPVKIVQYLDGSSDAFALGVDLILSSEGRSGTRRDAAATA
jgi:hypothetical protein